MSGIKGDTILLAQRKANERKANEYSVEIEKKMKKEKFVKTVFGVIFTVLFLAGWKIVADNDLESKGIVVAKESETDSEIVTMNGTVLFKHVIECEDGYWREKETGYPEDTEVSIVFTVPFV